MIDIHSHVLWGLDDGAATLEESLAMLQAAAEDGTTDIVATPHSNPQYHYDSDSVTLRLGDLVSRTAGRPAIHRGCDFHLSVDNLDQLLDQPSTYTIDGKQYLLVEPPDFHIGKHTEGVLERLVDTGIVPIITHPERNPALQGKLQRVEAWVELGCLVQVTAISITGGFGRSARRAVTQLLDRGAVHFVASDAHDPVHRHPRLSEARRFVDQHYGAETGDLLFCLNPRGVIEGRPLPAAKLAPSAPPRPWWRF